MTETCIFCTILAGELESSKVAEDQHAIAIMDVSPINVGHVLVIPRRHAIQLNDLTEDEAAQCMRLVHQVATALPESGVAFEGYHLLQANGAVAGQEVFHVHFHLIPRNTGDPLRILLDPERPKVSREDLDNVAGEINSAMKKSNKSLNTDHEDAGD